MRRPPVTSLIMAKRASMPALSSRRARTVGPSERLAACSAPTTSPSDGERFGLEMRRRVGPDQRHRLGEVADIVVGIAEQHRVHALGHQRAQHGRLDGGDRQVAGDGGQREPAIGVLDRAKIIDEQRQLAVARGVRTRRSRSSAKRFMAPPCERAYRSLGAGTREQRFGVTHAMPSIPLVFVADEVQGLRGDALEFAPAHQRFLAAMRDPDLGSARFRGSCAVSSSQSEWSEMMSGSSTPPCLARWRMRIQPDAKQEIGSGKRRAQRSAKAEGGPTTMAPAKSPFLPPSTVAGCRSPRSMPWSR